MVDKWHHDINESSSIFQGYLENMFSQNKIGFKISYINNDKQKLQSVNYDHFKSLFIHEINSLLEKRGTEGYEYTKIQDLENGITIIYPKITNDTEYGDSGEFDLYPQTAICPKCHNYIRLKKPEDFCNCGVPLDQFTFVAFCDECGAHYPLDVTSNILNNCPKCKQKNSLRVINWQQADNISSYRVSCTNCKYTQPLVLFKCNHTSRQNHRIMSNKPQNKFRATTARAGAILHPMILTMPNIPTMSESTDKSFSQAFTHFFKQVGPELKEDLLYLPDFWSTLDTIRSFWEKKKVIDIMENSDITNSQSADIKVKISFIHTLISVAYNMVENNRSRELVNRENYGIDEIEECLDSVKNKYLDIREQQGVYLLDAHHESNNDDISPVKSIPESGYEDNGEYLEKLGIEKINFIPDFKLLQANIGIIDGSTRREVLLFRTIQTENKPTVYIREISTEGIVFKLKSGRILDWLASNKKISIKSTSNIDTNDKLLRNLNADNSEARKEIYKLLHTFSHTLIQNASINTGLESSSLSEMIFPSLSEILIYSTNPVNVGGLEHTYDNGLNEWLEGIEYLAEECPQDPACMIDEHGACIACLFVPEFVCEHFNEDLDRSTLVGGERYNRGFFNA
jgi:hypothetical protein